MKNNVQYCSGCGTMLEHCDRHPNGDMGVLCARCRAEENHDFDKEPDVRFTRDGTQIDPSDNTMRLHGENLKAATKEAREMWEKYRDGCTKRGKGKMIRPLCTHVKHPSALYTTPSWCHFDMCPFFHYNGNV